MKFYVTFGQKSPFRNGWVEVEAESYSQALNYVNNALGNEFSVLYKEGEYDFNKLIFPRGKIGETIK